MQTQRSIPSEQGGTGSPSTGPQARYWMRFSAAMVAYAVTLIGSILIIRANPEAWWRFPLAVTPVIPVVAGVLAVVAHMRHLDELQQKIQLEALSFAFGCTAVLTFAYGFLEGVGFPHLTWIWVLPLMAALWGIGLALANRRYR